MIKIFRMNDHRVPMYITSIPDDERTLRRWIEDNTSYFVPADSVGEEEQYTDWPAHVTLRNRVRMLEDRGYRFDRGQ